MYRKEVELLEIHEIALPTLRSLQCSNAEDFELIWKTLRSGLEPYLISYWGMMNVLLKCKGLASTSASASSSCEIKALGKQCQEFLFREIKADRLPKQYGALSLETTGNACLAFVASGAAQKIKLENGAFGLVIVDSDKLATILDRVQALLHLGENKVKNRAQSGKGDLGIVRSQSKL